MRKGWLICVSLLPVLCLGQKIGQVLKHRIYFDFIGTDSRFMVRQPMRFAARDTAVWEALNFNNVPDDIYAGAIPKSPIMIGAWLNPGVADPEGVDVKSISKVFTAYRVPDTSEATAIALGITPANAAGYQYHVVEDDSIELLPWSPVRQLEQHFGAKRPYAFLGTYKAPGHRIMIEVVNKKDYDIRDGVIFDWRQDFRPIITEIDVVDKPYRYWNLHSFKGSPYATRFDPRTNLPLDLKFPVDTVDELTLVFTHHETLPYEISLITGRDTTVLSWWYLDDRYEFDSRYYDKPGKYELIIQARGNGDASQAVHIPFNVLPAPALQQKVTLRQILWYALSALCVIIVGFTLYYARNRTILQRSAAARQLASLQLKAIRSQLNPHFMFNALSSIQNLMNRNDLPGANHYLSTFAGLTRKVLLAGDLEQISLEDEVAILKDYLDMEQLRFGFRYQIHVDATVNQANVEIPAMLLQPFVENAVKHGVSGLHDAGLVEVSIRQSGNDLFLSVTDNGKGFEPAAQRHFGLKLGEERVALLNELNRDKSAKLDIKTGPEGTRISITLVQWL